MDIEKDIRYENGILITPESSMVMDFTDFALVDIMERNRAFNSKTNLFNRNKIVNFPKEYYILINIARDPSCYSSRKADSIFIECGKSKAKARQVKQRIEQIIITERKKQLTKKDK